MSEESQEFDRDLMNSIKKTKDTHDDEDLFYCQECGHLKDWCYCYPRW